MTTSKTHKSVKGATGKPRQSPMEPGGPPPTTQALAPLSSSIDKKPPEAVSPATDIPTEDPQKQWWYRKPESATRKLTDKIAILDGAGLKDDEIAKRLKSTVATVRSARYIARKNGWWDVSDQPIDVEVELALSIDRKVVRNLNASLDGQMTNWQTHETTLAAAKGRGMFRNHDVVQAQQTQLMPVAIQIIMPAIGSDDQRMEIPDAMCGGEPAYLEGDIVDGRSELVRTS